MSKTRKPSWILSFRQRKLRCRKLKDAQQEVRRLESIGEWYKSIKLKSKLRRVWWGIKRYANK